MVWNKVKQQLESFLNPTLIGIVEYKASGYRYTPEKAANCYLVVNKKEIFNSKDSTNGITWYQTEQEIKNDDTTIFKVTEEELEKVRKNSNNKIPEDRLEIIALGHKKAQYAKDVLKAQQELSKVDFQKVANTFLTSSIDHCLESDDIMLNILAIIDRRVGKKRLVNMKDIILMKHPVVRYFYYLRIK